MNQVDYPKQLEVSKDIPDIFELVKSAVYKTEKKRRPGLMLGLADLGGGGNAWLGGFHVVASNAIVLNTRPLQYLHAIHPELYKPYVFVVLLHEYLHTLGLLDEQACYKESHRIASSLFGSHIVSKMAADMSSFLPYFQFSQHGWLPSKDPSFRILVGFDRSSVTYIN
jgi:hypothetical protein